MLQTFVFNVALLSVGFIALIKGADWFVDGSSALAKNFKVPGLIIGLTIVALGTSAPELAVSISAALQGSNEIALSNVVGSDIFNLACVLGICAVIHPVPVDKAVLKRDFPLTIGAALLVLLVSGVDWSVLRSVSDGPLADAVSGRTGVLSGGMLLGGTGALSGSMVSGRTEALSGGMDAVAGNVGRLAGVLLLVLFLAYILYLIRDAKKRPDGGEAASGDEGNVSGQEGSCLPLGKCAVLICVGLGLIIAGGQVVVYSAKNIAGTLGMSETLIGLTVVAVGTSLPELVTSVVAARKGETGLAVGNVVGSNLFNILFILGASAAICPIDVNVASIYDMLILVAISLLTYLFSLSKGKIERPEGVLLLLFYGADVVFAILR